MAFFSFHSKTIFTVLTIEADRTILTIDNNGGTVFTVYANSTINTVFAIFTKFDIVGQCIVVSVVTCYSINDLFNSYVFTSTEVYSCARFNDCCSMVIDCVTSNITFPAGVVDCINYSFNCCDTIFTIYAWFTVNAVFHLTDCYVVFNNAICINGCFRVVTIHEVQTFIQGYSLSILVIRFICDGITTCRQVAQIDNGCFIDFLIIAVNIFQCNSFIRVYSITCIFNVNIVSFGNCLNVADVSTICIISGVVVYDTRFEVRNVVATHIHIAAVEFEFVAADCESSRTTVFNCVDVV